MDTLTETAFFYTFSTIAQALAGAIALLAAFVLFKLQSMDAEMPLWARAILEDFADQHHSLHQPLHDHFVQGHWDAFLASLPPDYAVRPGRTLEHKQAYHRLRQLWQQRTDIVTDLKRALLFTLGTMGLAVFVLAFAPHGGPWELSIVGAFMFSACLVTYWLIMAALWK